VLACELLDYAVMQKNYKGNPYNQSEASRRYSPAHFVSVTVRIKYGCPDRTRISTSFVERANLSVRHFNRRFTRLTLGWSRKLENHKAAIALFVAAHNFCKVHSTIKTTPACKAGITTEPWTIEQLVEAATI
jgi:hypothetical protein